MYENLSLRILANSIWMTTREGKWVHRLFLESVSSTDLVAILAERHKMFMRRYT